MIIHAHINVHNAYVIYIVWGNVHDKMCKYASSDMKRNIICLPGTYSGTVGVSACSSCPSGTSNGAGGSSSASACVSCAAGNHFI